MPWSGLVASTAPRRPLVAAALACALGCGPAVDAPGSNDETSSGDSSSETSVSTDAGGDGDGDGDGDGTGPDVYAPHHRSGSRLKVEGLEGPGGGFQFLRFHDSQTGGVCALQTAMDGVLRCLPPDSVSYAGYADEACTERLVTATPEHLQCSGGAYELSSEVGGECEQRVVVREAHPAQQVPDPLFGTFSDGECKAWVSPDPSLDYLRVGEQPAPSSFVRFELVPVVDDSGFGVLRAEGADGSRVTLGPYHASWGECSVGQLADFADGLSHCVPDRAALLLDRRYADPDCETEPLARASQCTRPVVALDTQFDEEQAQSFFLLFELGDVHTGLTYNGSIFADGCVEDPAPEGWILHHRGDAISPEQVPVIGTDLVLHGDFGHQWLVDEEGRRLLPGGASEPRVFYDRRYQASCRPVELVGTGELFCLPVLPQSGRLDYYADPDCTVPAVRFDSDELAILDRPLVDTYGSHTPCGAVSGTLTSVGRALAAYRATTPLDAAYYYDEFEGTCGDAWDPFYVYYALEEVDPREHYGPVTVVTLD